MRAARCEPFLAEIARLLREEELTGCCVDLGMSTPYVIYGSSCWDDAWLTEQNLAHALSRRHRVVFVEPPISPLTPIRYGLRDDTRSLAAMVMQCRPRAAGRVHVVAPLVLPPRSNRMARALSAPLLARQVRRALAHLDIQRAVAVTAQWAPGIVGAANEVRLVCLIKDWVEAGRDLLGRETADLVRDRDSLLDAADLVCATSRQLQRSLASLGVDAALLQHGFHAELAPRYARAEVPSDYRALPRPLLGYTGRIDNRLDFEILQALAERFRTGSVVLVGPVSPRLEHDHMARLKSFPNVHLIGFRARQSLPAYLVNLDCCLLPYRESEWLRHGAPLKLWDYLYAGPPVVGSGCTALLDFPPPLVRFARHAEGFCQAVEQVLVQDGPDDVVQRRRLAMENTWDHRADELNGLVMASGLSR